VRRLPSCWRRLSDRCIPFENHFHRARRLRKKAYEVVDRGDRAALDLRGTDGQDWYFARTWVSSLGRPPALYAVLDGVETHGYRFHVRPKRADATEPEAPDLRASELRASLSPEEERLMDELFPEEVVLLRSGYDWNRAQVFLNEVALRPDEWGRLIEDVGGWRYEWAAVPDEGTWRRYPLGPARAPLTSMASHP
jgi:hypothetical protein